VLRKGAIRSDLDWDLQMRVACAPPPELMINESSCGKVLWMIDHRSPLSGGRDRS